MEIKKSEIKRLIKEGYSTPKISKLFNTYDDIIKNIIKDDQYYKRLLFENGIRAKIKAAFKNGQSALYEKLRKEIKEKNIKCEECGSDKNVEIHHKERVHYDGEWNGWKADNWFHNKQNIRFLCNSCHQKLHWREDGRILKIKQDEITGRFIRNEN